ncbi:hypothetical protein KIN20_018759 [Parelaphostrongylus tenuis]|uniref:Uncharacterized protein n=1 Tax=Parelaphostrongylus tenuis TaxID=148309 RepID=A0AAD5MKG4_PARTN|nr:hypothetical protein KIN20_018759 [Parelaphostrongylus tenuis]
MGNSQSYDVTNVHRRNTGHPDEEDGSVKPLGYDTHHDEDEKQENKSPKLSSDHKEFSAAKQYQDQSENITEISKQSTGCVKSEAVSDVTHCTTEIALESLHRVLPLETLPLDARPTQCSYD